MRAMAVRCLLYDVSELRDQKTFCEAMDCLPWEARRARVRRYKFAKDQCLSLGAGLLAAYALTEAGAHDLGMAFGQHGKPYLQHHPHIHFNLSHSGHVALCAVGEEPVGADVEVCHAYDAGIAEYSFTDDERRWILAQPDTGRAFTRVWVRKESYLKLCGTGLTDYIRSLSVLPGAADVGDVTFWESEHERHHISICCKSDSPVSLECAPPRFWASDVW